MPNKIRELLNPKKYDIITSILTAKTENNQRALLEVAAIPTVESATPPTEENSEVITQTHLLEATEKDCTPTINPITNQTEEYDKVTRGDIITKHKGSCTFQYTIDFDLMNNETGEEIKAGQSPNGIPTFRFHPIDNAGNVPNEERLNQQDTDSSYCLQ